MTIKTVNRKFKLYCNIKDESNALIKASHELRKISPTTSVFSSCIVRMKCRECAVKRNAAMFHDHKNMNFSLCLLKITQGKVNLVRAKLFKK